jgi:hypothetical protein
MDATLLAHIRTLIDDKTAPYAVSDQEIANLGATRRRELYFDLLVSKDDLVWYAGYNYVEVTRLTDEYEGAGALTPTTADPIEGRWAFAAEQIAVYVYGFAYDLMDIVSMCWLYKADTADVGINYSLGDESVDSSAYKQHCISQYHRYRTSRSGQWRRHR